MSTHPLPLVKDIVAIAKLETHEDAMMIAWDKIVCLFDMSLEGDFPKNLIGYNGGWGDSSFNGELSSSAN
jgi:hypothetical protein